MRILPRVRGPGTRERFDAAERPVRPEPFVVAARRRATTASRTNRTAATFCPSASLHARPAEFQASARTSSAMRVHDMTVLAAIRASAKNDMSSWYEGAQRVRRV